MTSILHFSVCRWPKQSALFTELNYAFTECWKLTAGVRWYTLQYTTVRHEDGWSNGGPTLSTGEAKDTGFNPKVELSYQATPDQLYYVSASRGVGPGGVNTGNLADSGCGQDYGPYQPDSLWNYEVGGKTRWLNGAMQVNGAARADGQYVGISYPDFDRTDPATFQRAYTLLNLRAGLVHGRWELDPFLANALDKQAALSKFISDNYDDSTRTRMFTTRPRILGLSLEMKL